MNPIVEKIEDLEANLLSKRGTGRTDKMLDKVIEMALAAHSPAKFVVFALTDQIARYVLEQAVRRIPATTPVKVNRGGFIEINNVTIAFKSLEFKKGPSYKYQTWDCEFEDNSVGDYYCKRRIDGLKLELEPFQERAKHGGIIVPHYTK